MLLVMLQGIAATGQPIEIPLRVVERPVFKAPPEIVIREVQLASFDMLANPGRVPEAKASIGFVTTQSGIQSCAFRAQPGLRGGRETMVLSPDEPFEFSVFEQNFVRQTGNRYLLVEYFDNANSGASLVVQYNAGSREKMRRTTAGELLYTSSSLWRKQQFLLRDAVFVSDIRRGADLAIVSHENAEWWPKAERQCSQVRLIEPSDGRRSSCIGSAPLEFTAIFANTKRTAVVDQADANRSYLDRLRIDSNGDGNPFNDSPTTGTLDPRPGPNGDPIVEFRSVPIEIPDGATTGTYRCRVRVRCLRTPAPPGNKDIDVSIAPDMYLETVGDVDGLGGRLAIADANTNGIFGDKFRASSSANLPTLNSPYYFPAGDEIRVIGDEEDPLVFPTHLALGEKLYSLRVHLTPPQLTLTPVDTSASIRLAHSVRHLTLISGSLEQMVLACNAKNTVPVPPGNYRLGTYVVEKADKQGATWRATGHGSTKRPPIPAYGTTSATLAFGEPFMPEVAVSAAYTQPRPSTWWWPFGGTSLNVHYLAVLLHGAGGELIPSVSQVGAEWESQGISGQSFPATYRIYSKKGELVAAGRFEYG